MRAAGFFLFVSAYWALLPLVAREQIGGGPDLYGVLLGVIGAGAVVGAFLLPWAKATLGADRLMALGALGQAVAMVPRSRSPRSPRARSPARRGLAPWRP